MALLAQHSAMLSHIFANGGLILWAIGLCSVLALAVTIERLLRLLPLNKRLRAEWALLERALGRRERGPP